MFTISRDAAGRVTKVVEVRSLPSDAERFSLTEYKSFPRSQVVGAARKVCPNLRLSHVTISEVHGYHTGNPQHAVVDIFYLKPIGSQFGQFFYRVDVRFDQKGRVVEVRNSSNGYSPSRRMPEGDDAM